MKKPLEVQALSFRINPNEEQIKQFNTTAKAYRRVYNYYLEKRKSIYEQSKATFSYYDCCKDLTSFRKEEAWLQKADAQALRCAVKELDNDYVKFFATHRNYPSFKKNPTPPEYYRYYKTICNGNNIELRDYSIKLPKLGEVSTIVPNDKSTLHKNQGINGGRIVYAIVEQIGFKYYNVKLFYTQQPIQIQKPLKNPVSTPENNLLPNPAYDPIPFSTLPPETATYRNTPSAWEDHDESMC